MTATGLSVQLRPVDGSELLCARIAPGTFRRKGKTVRFSDKKGKLGGAGGLAGLLLKSRKGGSVALALAAKKATFATPSAGPLTLTFGFGDGATPGQCMAVTSTFRAKKGGVIVTPYRDAAAGADRLRDRQESDVRPRWGSLRMVKVVTAIAQQANLLVLDATISGGLARRAWSASS